MADDYIQKVMDDIVTSNLRKIYGDIEIYRDEDDLPSANDWEWSDEYPHQEPVAAKHLVPFGVVFAVLSLILIAVLGINLYISEFWVPAYADPYTYPKITPAGHLHLLIGDTYELHPALGPNEEIKKIMNMDPDVISLEGKTVTANAEFFQAKVMIITGEIEVPPLAQKYSGVVFLGKDYSDFLNRWRASLREYMGIEDIPVQRTELRDLAVYEYTFSIKGILDDPEPEDLGTIYSGTRHELDIHLEEGEIIESIETSDGEILTVIEETDEDGIVHYYVEGLSTGDAEVIIRIGFMKTVDGEVYRDYLETAPQEQ